MPNWICFHNVCQPTDARLAFPCWDEPSIKATFDVTLVVPQDRVALSNMVNFIFFVYSFAHFMVSFSCCYNSNSNISKMRAMTSLFMHCLFKKHVLQTNEEIWKSKNWLKEALGWANGLYTWNAWRCKRGYRGFRSYFHFEPINVFYVKVENHSRFGMFLSPSVFHYFHNLNVIQLYSFEDFITNQCGNALQWCKDDISVQFRRVLILQFVVTC